jgi:hypothetical protein
MANEYTLTDETPTAAITSQGWEKFMFVRGDFGGGWVVAEFSPDGSNWFADSNLTFRKKAFDTFRTSASVRYRFRMLQTETPPNVLVAIA